MLGTGLLIFIACLALVLVVVHFQPEDFSISRSAVLSAAPSVIFGHINDLHKWEAWSPWVKMDPNAKSSYEGPAAGTGAIARWDGNKQVGAGSMTIVESKPGELIRIRLDFLKPFKATSTAEFKFMSRGEQTEVTWTMYGKNNFIGKMISFVMDCEKMVGGQFEEGLANLKSVVEKG